MNHRQEVQKWAERQLQDYREDKVFALLFGESTLKEMINDLDCFIKSIPSFSDEVIEEYYHDLFN